MTPDERLRTGADWLARRNAYAGLPPIPDDEVDMTHWACGTARCAAGHMAECPELRVAGLNLSIPINSNTYTITFECEWGTNALQDFFNLDEWALTRFFFRPKSLTEAVIHIDGYLKNKETTS